MRCSALMRVALYSRVSTDEQNIDQQRDPLVRYCKERDWQYRSFMDAAMSGSISDSPGWQDLLREAEKNGFDAIVVVKTDRITRSLKYAIQFYDWLVAHPTIKLVSIYDSVDPGDNSSNRTTRPCMRLRLRAKWAHRLHTSAVEIKIYSGI